MCNYRNCDKEAITPSGQGRKRKYCDSNCRKMEWYHSNKISPVIHPFSGKAEMPESPINTLKKITESLIAAVESDLMDECDVYQTVIDAITVADQSRKPKVEEYEKGNEPWSLAGLMSNITPISDDVESFVYVMECDDGTVKVGKANDPKLRCKAVSNASGKLMTRMESFKFDSQKDAIKTEFKVHKSLSKSKIHSEWYSISFEDAVLSVIEAINQKAHGGRGAL